MKLNSQKVSELEIVHNIEYNEEISNKVLIRLSELIIRKDDFTQEEPKLERLKSLLKKLVRNNFPNTYEFCIKVNPITTPTTTITSRKQKQINFRVNNDEAWVELLLIPEAGGKYGCLNLCLIASTLLMG